MTEVIAKKMGMDKIDTELGLGLVLGSKVTKLRFTQKMGMDSVDTEELELLELSTKKNHSYWKK